MENFNKMLDMIKNKGTEQSPDTDSDTGSFGNIEGEGTAPAPTGEKLVLHLEGGIEIHIPTAVYESMSAAMGGGVEAPVAPVTPCGGALEADGESEEKPTEDDKKDCPFKKEDDSESESDDSEKKEESDDDDDKKEETVEEGCKKSHKKKGKK